jgi:asparagine synthase (glutamine-hydrolysing)
MCGIAGIIHAELPSDELRAALERMQASLLHRGPDEGDLVVLEEARAGLAARRLSIVDLEHGSQPVANEDGTVFALLNGEIYNYLALREKLLGLGHRFRGRCDTEVIVHLYEESGPAFLDQLQGMFALAVYDTRQRRLLLARDGPGMKPLYYAQTKDGFLFASEARALFASGLIVPEPNPAAIDAFLAIGYVPAPITAFRGIQKLRAGQYVIVDSGGVRDGEFWQFHYQHDGPLRSDADYAAELDTLLSDAVRSHMAADVPVGAFLSGGWDSSLTSALAAKSAGRALKTFSVIFPDDPKADESRFSRRMAQFLESDHHEIEFRSSLMPELVPKILSHLEEPCANEPSGVVYVLSSLAARHVKVVLAGEGSDELFGGYEHFRVNYPYLLRPFVPKPIARFAAQEWMNPRWQRGFRLLGAPDERTADGEFARRFSPQQKRRALRPEFQTDGPDLEAVLIRPDVLATCVDRLERRLSFDVTARLANALLFAGDKMSMAHSLEMRMPFLDRSIVEFALRLPSRLKVHQGREKVILSTLARRYLPPEIAARRKQGLAYPAGFWSRPPCDRYARELLLDCAGNSPFNAQYLRQTVPAQLKSPGTRGIGMMVFLQAWWNEYFAGSGMRSARVASR